MNTSPGRSYDEPWKWNWGINDVMSTFMLFDSQHMTDSDVLELQ